MQNLEGTDTEYTVLLQDILPNMEGTLQQNNEWYMQKQSKEDLENRMINKDVKY